VAKIVISDEAFQKFREFFYRKTGIQFDDSKRYFVDKRLIERIGATGHTSFRSYFTFMRFQASGEELQALTNVMTVNETYFFREPYSIALYLTEYWPGIHEWDVELIASDIDTEILKKARAGKFSPRSVQHLPGNLLQQHFKRLSDGDYQISEDLRQAVEFTRINLHDPADTRPYRGFDVIFCRNLLIYFDDLSRRRAAEVFYDALNPGGFICLGHSESMSRITSLYKVRKFPEVIVYQKQEA